MALKKIISVGMVALAGSIAACDRELEIANPNQQTVETFWTTQEAAMKGVNAIYATFPEPGAMSRWIYFNYDLRSDEGYSNSPFIELRNWTKFLVSNYNFTAGELVWSDHYKGIYRANQVLQNVPGISMNEDLQKRLLGEAYFLRAYFYFNLVSLWGNVPLVLKANNRIEEVKFTTEAEVWAQIEKDLTEAAASLPDQYTGEDVGRPTKGAALACLGKSLLQQKKYSQALAAFQWVVEGEGKTLYGLMPDYKDNFTHLRENNQESVFEIQFSDRVAGPPTEGEDYPDHTLGNSRAQFFAPRGIGWSDGQCRRWVVDEFLKEKTPAGERDLRLATTCLFDSTDSRGPAFTNVYGMTFQQRFPGSREVWFHKYQNDYWRNDENYHSPINIRVVRYADALLMYAEILNALNRTAEAYPYVNRVRERAHMAPLSAIKPSLSQEAFLAQLKHERVVELAGESTRWNDLKRWGDLSPQLADRDPDFENFQKSKHEYLPILQTELDLNPNLKQNDNW